MRISEERLSDALGRTTRGVPLGDAHPVAAMLVESIAMAEPEHADDVRSAGRFLCELLWPGDGREGPALTLPVATHTYVREENTTPEEMRAHLGQTTGSDLLLGLATQALLRPPLGERAACGAGQRDAVLRVVYLLVRMYENQESTDALERAFEAEEPL